MLGGWSREEGAFEFATTNGRFLRRCEDDLVLVLVPQATRASVCTKKLSKTADTHRKRFIVNSLTV